MSGEPLPLPGREAAVLAALQAAPGRVLSRTELSQAAGLAGLSPRRVDSVLATLRRRLPPGSLVTVRGRGWLLARPDARSVRTESEQIGNTRASSR